MHDDALAEVLAPGSGAPPGLSYGAHLLLARLRVAQDRTQDAEQELYQLIDKDQTAIARVPPP